jgi:hypothetical protein
MSRPAFVVALAATLMSCGQAPNDLWGSIDESFPLLFDRVNILKQNLALRIEYIQDLHGGQNKVCKIVVDTSKRTIKDGTKLHDKAFREEVITVERVAATGGDFPPVVGGSIKFHTYRFKEKGRIDGEFTTLFSNGRNLLGNFDSRVQIVPTD